ncbi:MAG: RnfH family protein [Gammaproteobacteria bacterium]|nr:RnfH family protein [Gammaproteobacteria bacterium]
METIRVEIAYALPEQQLLLTVLIPKGSTVITAIMASGILDQFPELVLSNNVGIFSKKVALDCIVAENDRIEIYRPLVMTPNQLRLLRAKT